MVVEEIAHMRMVHSVLDMEVSPLAMAASCNPSNTHMEEVHDVLVLVSHDVGGVGGVVVVAVAYMGLLASVLV